MFFLNKLKNSIELSKLGFGFFDKLKIFYISFLFSIKKKLGFKNKHFFKINLKKYNKNFFIFVIDNSDLAILKEIFLLDEYNLNLDDEPKNIFDLGSNIGLSAIYFSLKYPNANIFCFEPDPDTFKRLNKNIENFNNISSFNFAISDVNKKTKFFVYPESSMSSSLLQRLPDQSCIDVVCKTLDSIMDDLNIDKIDLLKFDIEGGEFVTFKNFKSIDNVSNFIGELHLDLIGETKDDFLNIFKNFSSKLLKISEKRYVVILKKNK